MFRAAVIVIRCEASVGDELAVVIPACTAALARPAFGPCVQVSGAPAARATPADANQAIVRIGMTSETVSDALAPESISGEVGVVCAIHHLSFP